MVIHTARWTDVRYFLMAVAVVSLPHRTLAASTSKLSHHHHRSARQTLFFNIGTTPDPNQCTTPDGLEGSCIDLVSCSDLYNKLRSSPTPDFINFLRKSICRYEKSTPVICCAKSQPVISTAEPVDITEEPVANTTTPTPETTTETTTTEAPITTVPPPTGEALLPETCGAGLDIALRIVGGTPAPVGRYPWLAALGFEDGKGVIEFLCGGALITNQHIVTAAHCVRNRNDLKVVRLGEHNLDVETDGQHEDFGIEVRIIHENFNTISFANDIAILKLDKKVTFRDRIRPICLPIEGPFNSQELVARRDLGIVAGWGTVSYNNVSSNILLHVQLPIIPEAECKTRYEVFKQVVIDDTTLCAGRGGKDACQGDSGGPMMYVYNKKAYIVGVVSFGFRCAEPKYPGVYTRVQRFNEWIVANLN
ncbi:venom protease-like [Palaemon carinicauda]|uniref:venom protease-like n=1 Tax=Palaemon carinicauda TaxID=392227 RepID=UPI0035B63A39